MDQEHHSSSWRRSIEEEGDCSPRHGEAMSKSATEAPTLAVVAGIKEVNKDHDRVTHTKEGQKMSAQGNTLSLKDPVICSLHGSHAIDQVRFPKDPSIFLNQTIPSHTIAPLLMM